MKQEQEIFEQAMALPPGAEREGYLRAACGQNRKLRQSINELLMAFHEAGELDFFQSRERAPTARTTLVDNEADDGPGTVIGRYKLLQKIGEGGMGVVYMAQQEEPLRRRVALKIIKLGMDTRSVIARFEAERQALAMMDHPNIARVLDGGATNAGRPYFVMELVRGVRITEYCDQNNLSTAERLELFTKVCAAIQHAHQKGIIHRDIKPSNILVTLHDGVAVPKVIDFGIAKATADQPLTDKTLFTALEQFMGTPAYMSPEQAEMSGLDIDTRCDIYSLGVLLYEMLTGKTPFDAKELLASGLDAMRRTIREQEPVRPSTRLGTMLKDELTTTARHRRSDALKLIHLLRGDLDWIVMKCLEKDRARRYETAIGLAMDLQRHLDQEPVTARPPTPTYRLQKFARRNKGLVAAAASIALVLVLGIVVSAWQWRRAEFANRNTSRNNEQLRRALNQMDSLQVQRAEEFYVAGDRQNMLAFLAVVLRQNPTNHIAAERLFSTLVHRNWARFACPPLLHSNRIVSAMFSKDGRRVAAFDADGVTWAWDARSGHPLSELFPDEKELRSRSLFGLGVTSHSATTAQLRHSPSGRTLLVNTTPDITEHANALRSLQFSDDGTLMLTASGDRTARVWNIETGERIGQFAHPASIAHAAFSPNARRIVTASDDHTAQVWDLKTRNAVGPPLQHKDKVMSAAFDSEGRRVVTASWDNTARVWDAETGVPLTEPIEHGDRVQYAEFHPDGRRVLTISNTRILTLWEIGVGVSFSVQSEQPVSAAAFSPDGTMVAIASGGSVRFFNPKGRALSLAPLQQQGSINQLAFSPRADSIATASTDSSARVWNVQTGKPITPSLPHALSGADVSFSPDGTQILTCSDTKTATAWSASSGQSVSGPLSHAGTIRSARFSPDGKMILTASEDGTARLWDSKTGHPLPNPFRHDDGILAAEFSLDGQRVVTGSRDMTVRVWDVHTGRSIGTPLRHTNIITRVCFSPDGKRVASTGGVYGPARLWDSQNFRPIGEPFGEGNSIEFDAAGRKLLTSRNHNGITQIWEGSTGRRLSERLGSGGPVKFGGLSPDGQFVITAEERAARFWNVPSPPMPVPEWLLELAEALTGRHVNQQGYLEPLSLSELWARQQKTAASLPTP